METAAGTDDDEKPKVETFKAERDNKKGRAQNKRNVERAKMRMSGDILGGVIDLINATYTAHYNHKYRDELQKASESVHALNKADILVRKAIQNLGFPEALKGNKNKQLTDLVNYITDGTRPAEGLAYADLIQTWGNLIFNNESKILKGEFNFAPRKIVPKIRNTGQGNLSVQIRVNEITGNDDPEVIKANEKLEKVTIPSSNQVVQ